MTDTRKLKNELEQTKKEVDQLRNELDLVRTALIPTIQKVIMWHSHQMNGEVVWNIPSQYLTQMAKMTEKIPTPQDTFSSELKPSVNAEA